MKEREAIMAALSAIEEMEINAYHELVAAQERHRALEHRVDKFWAALRDYEAAHPDEIWHPIDGPLDLA